jgi:hypothetical protein
MVNPNRKSGLWAAAQTSSITKSELRRYDGLVECVQVQSDMAYVEDVGSACCLYISGQPLKHAVEKCQHWSDLLPAIPYKP